MKAFVITIEGLELSESLAAGCVSSAKEYGIHVDIFKATDKFEAPILIKEFGLKPAACFTGGIVAGDKAPNQLKHAELGCFMSHYRLWNLCVELNEPIMVLEHDAYFVASFDMNTEFVEFLNINRTSQHRAVNNTAAQSTVMQYNHRWLRGTGGYCIKPPAAKKVIHKSHIDGINASDTIITRNLINIQDMVPHPIHHHVERSTIQNRDEKESWVDFNE